MVVLCPVMICMLIFLATAVSVTASVILGFCTNPGDNQQFNEQPNDAHSATHVVTRCTSVSKTTATAAVWPGSLIDF